MRNENGFKEILEKYQSDSKQVKVAFMYPGFTRPMIRRGKVLSVDEDCFTIDEIKQGESTYSYTYLIELKDGEVE